MPNWCTNKLTITGPDEDVRSFQSKAVGRSPWPGVEEELQPLSFHSLVPIPVEILTADYNTAGYSWEMENWGCKWGACVSEIIESWDGVVTYRFDTAWSPPIPVLEKVAVQWPTLTFVLEYEEPGVGFKGLAKFHGTLSEDHCLCL